MSRAMWQTDGLPMKTLAAGGTLRVSVEGGQDTPAEKYLKPPPAVGMASEPVTVRWEPGHPILDHPQQRAHEHPPGAAVRALRRPAPAAVGDADVRDRRRGLDTGEAPVAAA